MFIMELYIPINQCIGSKVIFCNPAQWILELVPDFIVLMFCLSLLGLL